MLVDAAKYGDVEIPYFCYEPKLGQPVGACRMCLVEIEGIPKLQTSCSTAVRDGMVVITTSDRVKHAQNAVVEFLLINHPLDCPVCDKGGECPLQDISFGWGAGRSRYIEPKRHFKKPLELSPLVAIDRERCILCYRCVRFSQEVAEDSQLVFLERGDHTFVGTHDGHPYVGPVQREHHRALPGGRAHLHQLPLPRPALGHRGRRDGVHALPLAVQRAAHDPRRRPGGARAGARQPRGGRRLALRQGALRLPGLRGRGANHRADGARRGLPARGELGARAVRGLDRPGEGRPRRGRLRERPDHQRGGLPRAAADARRPRLRRVDSRDGAAPDPVHARRLARPDLSARVSDIDHADADPRAGHRAGGRGPDPGPARPQGRAPQRRPPRHDVGPAVHARRQRHRRGALAPPGARRRRWARWPRRSALRAREDRSTSWPDARGPPPASAPAPWTRTAPALTERSRRRGARGRGGAARRGRRGDPLERAPVGGGARRPHGRGDPGAGRRTRPPGPAPSPGSSAFPPPPTGAGCARWAACPAWVPGSPRRSVRRSRTRPGAAACCGRPRGTRPGAGAGRGT